MPLHQDGQLARLPSSRQGDAADDPTIWVNRANAAASRVLGSNKKQGLLVYDLQGRQTQLLEVGRLNNVDLRQDIAFAGQRVDLAEPICIATGLNELYGMCLYRPADDSLLAFVNDEDGRFQQYRIDLNAGQYGATLLRTFKVASQPEGCVVDDKRARLFLGEEKRGLWTTSGCVETRCGSAVCSARAVSGRVQSGGRNRRNLGGGWARCQHG